jgi:hypothetical protein
MALSELYTWTTTGLAACFPSFIACLLARQEGSKRKTAKDDRYRQLWLARNAPREKLVLTQETNPTFFDAVKNEHFLRNCSRTELRPEVYDKFAPFLRKQAKLTRKRTCSMDNWTGSLAHIGAMMSANQESGAYQKCGSVDSDIVTYVNCYEIDDNNKVKTVRRAQKATHTPRPLPIPFPISHWGRPKFEADVKADVMDTLLPSVHVEREKSAEAEMGIELATITVPTLSFVSAPPKDVVKPQAVRIYPNVDRI